MASRVREPAVQISGGGVVRASPVEPGYPVFLSMLTPLSERRVLQHPLYHVIPAAGTGPVWYLAGGINPADCVLAYQPKGAADLASSYINIAHPGTLDASPATAPPGLSPTDGWLFDGTKYLNTGMAELSETWTHIIQYKINVANHNGSVYGNYHGDATKICTEIGTYGGAYSVYHSAGYGYGGLLFGPAYPVGDFAVVAIAGNKAYINGVPFPTPIPQFGRTVPSPPFRVGWSGENSKLNGAIVAVASYNRTLSQAEITAVTENLKLRPF